MVFTLSLNNSAREAIKAVRKATGTLTEADSNTQIDSAIQAANEVSRVPVQERKGTETKEEYNKRWLESIRRQSATQGRIFDRLLEGGLPLEDAVRLSNKLPTALNEIKLQQEVAIAASIVAEVKAVAESNVIPQNATKSLEQLVADLRQQSVPEKDIKSKSAVTLTKMLNAKVVETEVKKRLGNVLGSNSSIDVKVAQSRSIAGIGKIELRRPAAKEAKQDAEVPTKPTPGSLTGAELTPDDMKVALLFLELSSEENRRAKVASGPKKSVTLSDLPPLPPGTTAPALVQVSGTRQPIRSSQQTVYRDPTRRQEPARRGPTPSRRRR